MICPRCSRDTTPRPLVAGKPAQWCLEGPFGSPCGMKLVTDAEVRAAEGPRPVLEKDIQRGVIRFLEMHSDVVVLRQSVGLAEHDGRRVMHGVPGQADLTVAIGPEPAIVEFWEIKKPDGRQSEMQRKFEARVTRVGARYRIITSIDDAKAALADARMRRVG